MGLYEIMFIIRTDMETEEHQEVLDGLKNTITGNGGEVDKIIDWRRRRLAYEIEKHTEGYYYLVYFKGHGTIIQELEHFFKVNDAILRFLIIRVEEDYYDKATAEEPETKEAVESPDTAEDDEQAVAVVDAAVDTQTESEETATEVADPKDAEGAESEQSPEPEDLEKE